MRALAIAVLAAGCGRVGFEERPSVDDAADSCALGEPALGVFTTPTIVETGRGAADDDDDPTPADDDLELVFVSTRAGTADVWRQTRTVAGGAWGPAVEVVELSSPSVENTPTLSRDGLTIWLASDRPGGMGMDDLYVAHRTTRDGTWSTPELVPELESSANDRGPSLFLDDLHMMFHSGRAPTGAELFETRRADTESPWSPPVNLAAPVGIRPWISPCGLELYYQVNPGGGQTSPDFYMVRRATLDEPFGPRTLIPELSSPAYDQDLRLSPDRRHAYLASSRDGHSQIYEASR